MTTGCCCDDDCEMSSVSWTGAAVCEVDGSGVRPESTSPMLGAPVPRDGPEPVLDESERFATSSYVCSGEGVLFSPPSGDWGDWGVRPGGVSAPSAVAMAVACAVWDTWGD